jgi:hypothetical protein
VQHVPATIATTGFGRRRIWTCRSVTWKRPTPRFAASSSPTYPVSPRTRWSPPEQKASGPSPQRITTPTSMSSRARSNALLSSTTVWGRKALRTSGRSIVIFATPSASS